MSSIEHRAVRYGRTLMQSGLPTRPLPASLGRANGLLVRGVVVATYVVDDENHPNAGKDAPPVAVYCDVLSYSNISGTRWRFIKHAIVAQDRGALHSGRVWKPRATSLDVTKETVSLDVATNPANLDGDHVLVGFLDDNLNTPVILEGLPHPSADVGNEDKTAGRGHRLRLKLEDGDPDFWKHHGTFYGINNAGDFEVDTTFAHDGELEEDGKEKPPPTDGKGAQRARLPQDAEHIVQLLDLSDAAQPKQVGAESFKKLLRKTELTLDAERITEIQDQSGASPVAKAIETFTKVLKQVRIDDAGGKVELLINTDTKIVVVEGKLDLISKDGTKLVVTDAKIELGSDGAGDKAVLDSKLQTELSGIKADLDSIKSTFGSHTHPYVDTPAGPSVTSPPAAPMVLTYVVQPTNSGLVTIKD